MSPAVSRPRVAVFAGARSTEHEVSLSSSYNIVNAIDRDKYEVFVVGIDKQGVWRRYDPDAFVENPKDFTKLRLGKPISGRLAVTQSSRKFYDLEDGGKVSFECDIVFPAVLGNYAEDGTMQGLLRMMDVPFTTPDVLGSAVGMDKDVMKRLCQQAGIPTAKFVMVRKNQLRRPSYEEISKKLGSTVFIKPANNGSSVGVYKVANVAEFDKQLEQSFKYDVKILIEEAIVGREIEISMMGNIGSQKVSLVGEIVEKTAGDFYSYDNKYVHSDHVELIAPAKITKAELQTVQEMALKVCETLECEGFSRLDFFLRTNGEVVFNEINTMPGFTPISMFPRLWSESGVSYPELVDKLLQLALERYQFRIAPIVTDLQAVAEPIN